MTTQLCASRKTAPAAAKPTARSAAAKRSHAKEFFASPATLGFGLLLVVVTLAVFIGPFFARNPVAAVNPRLLAPSGEFWLGTDHVGRDYLARVLQGGQTSLLVGFGVALLCMTLGLLFGATAGFYGGLWDRVLVKIAEFFQALPGMIVALVAAALLGANVWIIIVILSVTMWPGVARIARAESLRIAELGYVEAARAAGFSRLRILWSDAIPNAMPPVLVATTMMVGRAILIESGLAYLGISDANRPSWGALLNSAQTYATTALWLAIFPGACIFAVVLAINFIGDRLNDVLNPTIGKVK